jgi:hypothetical protein
MAFLEKNCLNSVITEIQEMKNTTICTLVKATHRFQMTHLESNAMNV